MKKELKNTDFDKNTIASELNLTGIMQCSSLHELINKLNVNRHYDKIEPLIEQPVEVPEKIAMMMNKEKFSTKISADTSSLIDFLMAK